LCSTIIASRRSPRSSVTTARPRSSRCSSEPDQGWSLPAGSIAGSRLVESLAETDESYASVRDAAVDRGERIGEAARTGRITPERYVGRDGDGWQRTDSLGGGNQ